MTKKSSRRKNIKRKPRKKSGRRVWWWKMAIALTILIAVVIYLLLQYDGWYVLKDLCKGYLAKREIEVNLYFADPNSDYLVGERRIIPKVPTQQQMITKTIEELIKGSKRKLVQTIPPTTIIKNVRIDNSGVVWLDFSSHISQDHPGGSSAEIITVYSIVDTVLLNFKEVKKVGILIDGLEIETLAGHIDCSRPFVVKKDFVK